MLLKYEIQCVAKDHLLQFHKCPLFVKIVKDILKYLGFYIINYSDYFCLLAQELTVVCFYIPKENCSPSSNHIKVVSTSQLWFVK